MPRHATRLPVLSPVLATLALAGSAAAQSAPAVPEQPTAVEQPAGRVEVQRYLELQERYARNLSETELANRSIELEQEVRNQTVKREVDTLESEVREMLGRAIGTPSEQTVQDLLKVLEARHGVPQGQQVYFERRYRPAPRTTTQSPTRTRTTSPRTMSPQPATPQTQSVQPQPAYPQSTFPQTYPTTPYGYPGTTTSPYGF